MAYGKMRRFIALVLVWAMILPLCNWMSGMKVEAASAPFIWEEAYTLTNKLTLQNVETQAKDEEVLFSFDMLDDGIYAFTYNLDDLREAVFKVHKKNNAADVYYSLYRYDAISGDRINITDETDVMNSYAEVKYDKSTLDFAYEEATPTLENISTTPTTTTDQAIAFKGVLKTELYPGGAFKVSNTEIHYKWNGDTFYFSTSGLQEGKVTPFVYTFNRPGEAVSKSYKKLVMTKLEDFIAKPTHYKDSTSKRIINQNDGERTGQMPGIDFTFKHPKVYDEATHRFVYEDTATGALKLPEQISLAFYLEEYGSSGKDKPSTAFKLKLNGTGGLLDGDIITGVPLNTNKRFTYDNATKEYKVSLVKSMPVGAGVVNDNYVIWDELNASRIYKTVVLSSKKMDHPDGNYEFSKYKPESGYSYTYLEYILKRESIDDAFLEVVPYQGIKNDVLKYQVYRSYQSDYLDDEEEVKTELWLTYTHEISADNYDGKLFIPVEFSKTDSFYKIKIRFDGQISKNSLFTQLLKYRATIDEIVPPPVPTINTVSDIKVVPPASGSSTGEPSKVTFDVAWNAPKEDSLKELLQTNGGKLYYQLLISNEAKNKDNYSILKVFEVKLDGGQVKVGDVTNTSSATDGKWDYNFGYNSINNSFRMDDIILKDDSGWAKILEINKDDADPEEQIRQGNFVWDQTKPINEVMTDIDELPNLNFLRMRAIYIRNKIADPSKKEGSTSDHSFAKSLTLGYSTVEIPSPTNLAAENLITGDKTVRYSFSWDIADTSNYRNFMLEPVGKAIKDVYYDLYMAKDRSRIEDLSLQGHTYIEVDGTADQPTVELTEELVTKLRNNEVIAIRIKGNKNDTVGRNKIYFNGGDMNQVYYYKMYTNIDITEEFRASSASEIISHTTFNYGKPIDDILMPLTPTDFAVKEKISPSSIKIGWTRNMTSLKPGESIGYELVRVKGHELPNIFNNRTAFEEVVKASKDYKGYRILDTDGTGFKMKEYNEETNAWDEVLDSHTVVGNNVTVTDNELVPNTIYYYYVRAVRVTLNNIVAIDPSRPASGWAALTYTSAPLQKPINLTQDFNTYSYDQKSEAIVYFDVAIPDATTGVKYIPEIYIFSEDDTRYNRDYELASTGTDPVAPTTNGAPVGYMRYYKRIDNLKSSKSYSIKVRVVTDETPAQSSPFSDYITIRTEFDKDNYERNILLDKYLNYYDLEALKLFQGIYWVMEDDKTDYSVKFRETIASDMLVAQAGSGYELDSGDFENVEVYIPSKIVDIINEEGISFSIKTGQMGMTLVEDTLNKADIKELREFIDRVEKTSDLREYYVKVILKRKSYKARINGNDPISDYMRVNIEIVGSKEYEENLEDEIMRKLDTLIAQNRKSMESELITALNNNKTADEELLQMVDSRIEYLRKSHNASTKLKVEQATKTDFVDLYQLSEPMTIYYDTAEKMAVSLYRQNGTAWKQEKAKSNSTGIFGVSDLVGEFIFAGYAMDEIFDGNIKDGKFITDLLHKYNLTDIFTISQLADLEKGSSKYSIYASLARMLGAKEDVDAAAFLKSQGVKGISGRNMYGTMMREEAFYVIVQVHSLKNDVNLDAVAVSNWGLIQDSQEVDPQYLDVLLKGATLTVIRLEDGNVMPADKITVRDVLETLVRIEYRNW